MFKILSIFLIFILGLIITLPFPKNTKGIVDCKSGPIRATGLVVSPSLTGSFSTLGACVIDPQAAPFLPFRIPTYEDLKSLYYTQAKSAIRKEQIQGSPNQGDQGQFASAFSQNDIVLVDGDLSGINISVNPNKASVIFIERKLTFGRDLTYNNNDSGLVFVVKEDVIIEPQVTQIDAVIISSGNIYTAGENCTVNSFQTSNPLVINGSLISLSTDSSKKIHFCRKVSGEAGEIINHQPKYLVILRNIYSDILHRWSEIP